jgi:hypothetical protein
MQVMIFMAFPPSLALSDSTKPARKIASQGRLAPHRNIIRMPPMSGQANKSGRTKRKESETKYRGGKTAPTPKRHATPDDQVEQGLEGSLPGSDAVAVTQPPHNPHDARRP